MKAHFLQILGHSWACSNNNNNFIFRAPFKINITKCFTAKTSKLKQRTDNKNNNKELQEQKREGHAIKVSFLGRDLKEDPEFFYPRSPDSEFHG